MVKRFVVFILIGIILPVQCKKEPFRVNVAGTDADLQIERFEKILFSADPSTLEQNIPKWKNDYGVFFRDYAYILKLGSMDDPDFPSRLKLFITDQSNYRIYKRTMQVFPDLQNLTKELNSAFKHYRYYFPDKPFPKIITYVSGLNQSAITDDNLLAIGLDKYLGSSDTLYGRAGIYNYLMRNMHPQKIISDCMVFWGETEFPYNDSIDNLISKMIYNGKLAYFEHAMLPGHPDTLLWGFSNDNLNFCLSDEKSMWTYLIENKLLFNTDKFTIDKFILEGPFTKDFGRNSPARAVNWLGYRIVQSYIDKNNNVSLSQLMRENDYMKILNLSAYNP
jgi:hypothetical protein